MFGVGCVTVITAPGEKALQSCRSFIFLLFVQVVMILDLQVVIYFLIIIFQVDLLLTDLISSVT